MTDLVITASEVLPTGSTVIEHGYAGEAIDAGEAVYKDAADKKFKLADSDSATAAAKVAYGIALNGAAADGQPIAIAKGGDVTLSDVMTAGTSYYLSAAAAGGIAPFGDLTTGDDVVLLGVATSDTNLSLRILNSGVTL